MVPILYRFQPYGAVFSGHVLAIWRNRVRYMRDRKYLTE